MNRIKIKMLLLFLMFTNIIFGTNFRPGKITFENGVKQSGYVKIPKNAESKTIHFKNNLTDNKPLKIKSKDLTKIEFQSKAEKTNTFHYTRVINVFGKPSKKSYWLYVLLDDYATLYLTSTKYLLNKDGEVVISSVYIEQRDLPSFSYYFKNNGEEFANFLSTTTPSGTLMFGQSNVMRTNANKFLSDYPELIERINNKEFKHTDVFEMIKIYNDYMKKTNIVM